MPGRTAAGMPEAGYLPIPRKLARAGVKDMVRISDARMCGTAFGTIVLHVAPEAAVGGPLAAVRNGDRIRAVGREEAHRPAGRRGRDPAAPGGLVSRRPCPQRGYAALYRRRVMQAPQGCDFDFLVGNARSD